MEPGGYYEHGLRINKPTVACVVGRWKARSQRRAVTPEASPVQGDDATAKEKWFMDYFGVNGIYDPQTPIFSKKRARS